MTLDNLVDYDASKLQKEHDVLMPLVRELEQRVQLLEAQVKTLQGQVDASR